MDANMPVAVDPTIQFILAVKVRIPPEKVEEFFTWFRPVYNSVVAEPECRYFVVGQDQQTPGVLWWCEGWAASTEWFQKVSRHMLEAHNLT